jgi:hypothetical protein
MHSLRKRAKLESSQEDRQTQKTTTRTLADADIGKLLCHESECVLFSKMPIEIVYSVFEKLNVNDLMKLRLMNKNFRDLIDKSKHVWRKVSVGIKVESSNLCEFLEFLGHNEKIRNIHSIKLDCTAILKKKLLNNPQEIQAKIDGLCPEKEFTVCIAKMNSLSICCINYFNYCTILIIEMFVDTMGQVKSLRNSSYFECELNPFQSLKILDVNCKIYDLISGEYFKWININAQNRILNKMENVFYNLKELYIRFYSGSFKELIKSLKSLTRLKVLELDNPCLNNRESIDLQEDTENSELKLESLALLSANIELVSFLLNKLSPNLVVLTKLDLFVSNSDLKIYSSINFKDETSVKTLRNTILSLSALNDLKYFTTNLAQIINKNDLEFIFSTKSNMDEINLVNFMNREYTHRKNNRQHGVSSGDFQIMSPWKNVDFNSLINIITNVVEIKKFKIDLFYTENNQRTFADLNCLIKNLKIQENKFEFFYINAYFLKFDNEFRFENLKSMAGIKICFKTHRIKMSVPLEEVTIERNVENFPLAAIDLV